MGGPQATVFENDSEPNKIEIDWPPAVSRPHTRHGYVRPHRGRRSVLHTVRLMVGRVFLSTGILLFGFVGYQLWGTKLQEARAQDSLAGQFEQVLAAAPAVAAGAGAPNGAPGASTAASTTVPAASGTTAATGTTAAGGTAATRPGASTAPTGSDTSAPTVRTTVAPEPGDPVARLVIDKIGVDKIVVSGVDVDDLRKGPGHFPGTPLPGERGNAAIAGHRTTFGAPFNRIDELDKGDRIEATTVRGTFVYVVSDKFVVNPDQYEVVGPADNTVLTLVSCHPKLSAANRIIIRAELDASASSAVTEPAPPAPVVVPSTGTLPGGDDTAPGTSAVGSPGGSAGSVGSGGSGGSGGSATTAAASSTSAAPAVTQDAFTQNWFSDELAWADVAIWGGLLTGISLLAWRLSVRKNNNWVGGLAGIGPFLVCLYFFYENISRLLPPGL